MLEKTSIAITQAGSTSSVLTVHPSVPARSPQEVVALSKRTRGGLNFGSNGTGTSSHLAGVMFMQLAGAAHAHSLQGRGAGRERAARWRN